MPSAPLPPLRLLPPLALRAPPPPPRAVANSRHLLAAGSNDVTTPDVRYCYIDVSMLAIIYSGNQIVKYNKPTPWGWLFIAPHFWWFWGWFIIGITTWYDLLPLFDAQNNFILVISDCRFFLQLKPANGATNWTGPSFVGKGSCLAFEESSPTVDLFTSHPAAILQPPQARGAFVSGFHCGTGSAAHLSDGPKILRVCCWWASFGSTEGISSWNRWRFGEDIYQTAWWFTQALQETSGAL